MKKSLFLVLLGVMILNTGCATLSISHSSSSSTTTTTTTEEIKVDYITKYELRNEIAVEAPAEATKRRSELKYGTIKHVTYHSNTCKMDRGLSIWLPSSYDGTKKFPVVYFQHGIFGDENCIIQDSENKIPELATNLAADGYAKEMIFVFGNMYATDDPSLKPAFNNEATAPYDNYINELINDIMPYVEANYAVLTGRENTAICGFSMGGRESLYIGFQRPDLFKYIGAIAPAPGLVQAKDWAMTHPGMLKENEVKFSEDAELPELLMVCCGTNDSVVGQFPKSYHKILVNNNVDHLWFEVLSADHNAMAIKTGLYQFIQRIF